MFSPALKMCQVKDWITVNEPWIVAYLGYGNGVFAPGITGAGNTTYIAGHNLLKAHARAYHIYDEEFRPTQKGRPSQNLKFFVQNPQVNSKETYKQQKRRISHALTPQWR